MSELIFKALKIQGYIDTYGFIKVSFDPLVDFDFNFYDEIEFKKQDYLKVNSQI